MPTHKFPYKANVHVKNSQGFGVLSSGISLERYKKNPIVLLNHDTNHPIGTADSLEFTDVDAQVVVLIDDTDDSQLQKVARDIKKNLYKGLSLGIDPDFESVKFGVEGFPPDLPVITKSTLMELSVTPLPANEDCLRFTHKGAPLSAQDVMVRLSAVPTQTQPMSKLLLTAIPILGLKAGATEDEVIASLMKLSADQEELTTLRQAKIDWEKKEAELKLSHITEQVETAIEEKRILPSMKQDYITLGANDPSALKRILQGIPARKTLSAQTTGDAEKDEISGKSFKELMKSNPEALIKLKVEDPQKWQELFNKENWNK